MCLPFEDCSYSSSEMYAISQVEMIILARQRAHRDALKAAAGGRQLTRLELKEGIVQGGLESSLYTLFSALQGGSQPCFSSQRRRPLFRARLSQCSILVHVFMLIH